MWVILTGIISNLPEIISGLKSLFSAIELGAETVTVTFKLKKFQNAADKAKDTKDTGDLEDIFRGKK